MTSNWLRFLIWLLVIGVGGVLVTVLAPAVGRCIGVEPEKACPLVRYAPLSWRAKTITVINHCPSPVAVAVTYDDEEDLPHTVGWQEVPAEASAKVHSGSGTPVVSYGASYDFKVVHRKESQRLPDPRRVDDMRTAHVFSSIEAWRAETTRMRVACP